jgi:hypothetical protein
MRGEKVDLFAQARVSKDGPGEGIPGRDWPAPC